MRHLIGSRRRVLVVACDGFVNQGFPDDQSGSWTQDFETIKRLCASALRRPCTCAEADGAVTLGVYPDPPIRVPAASSNATRGAYLSHLRHRCR
jgi:hypothetical protein